MQINVASNSNSQLEKVQRYLPITAEALNIPVDIIPPSTLNNIFKKTEELFNKDGSVTKKASSTPNTRTVKKSYNPKPHILTQEEKVNFMQNVTVGYSIGTKYINLPSQQI